MTLVVPVMREHSASDAIESETRPPAAETIAAHRQRRNRASRTRPPSNSRAEPGQS